MAYRAMHGGGWGPPLLKEEGKLARRPSTPVQRSRPKTTFLPRAATGVMGGVMEKMAAANAEMLARKEGKELVGKKTGGVQPLKSFPAEVRPALFCFP